MNNFREWLSDNLRYILLIIGILVILVGLFFGVRAVSKRFGSSGNDEFSSDSVVSDTGNSVKEAVTSSVATVSENKGGELKENAVPEVTELIQNYYTAMEQQDVSAVQKLCDTLPETEAAKIASSTTKYTDLKVYTKNGLVADSYVVYVYYHYQNEGQAAPLPGLSRMLVRKNDAGTWQIVYSDYDQATSDYIDSLENEDDVKALVQQVQQEYDAAQQTASENAVTSSAASPETTSSEAAASSETQTVASSSAETTENGQSDAGTAVSSSEGTAESRSSTTESSGTKENSSEKTSGSERKSSASTRSTTLNAGCFVRATPGYDGKVLGQLKAGTEVTVIGDIQDGWWHIRSGNYDGYVGRRFIS